MQTGHAPHSWDALCRRAGGRRAYNSLRQFQARLRRHEVVRLWQESGGGPGWQTRAARSLGVHPSTVSRDVAAVWAELNRTHRCPLCGAQQPGREARRRHAV